MIETRNAGCAAILDNRLYVWGGHTLIDMSYPTFSDSDDSDDESESEDVDPEPVEVEVDLPRADDLTHPFDVLDLSTRQWSKQPTSGDVPTSGNGSSLSMHLPTRSLYLIGGWNEGNFDSEVYKILVGDWRWKKLKLTTGIKPSPRYITGVLIYKNVMCMFGGVGPKIVDGQDPGAEYKVFFFNGVERNFGWNNEYYEFDLDLRKSE